MGSVLENFLSEVATEAETKAVNDQKKTAPHQKKSASSSLMDIRDMAQRYHRMRDVDRMREIEADFVDATDDWPLADSEVALAEQIVVPETEEEKQARAARNRLLIPLVCVSGIALIATTAAVTLLITGGAGGGSSAVAKAQGGVAPAVVDSSSEEAVLPVETAPTATVVVSEELDEEAGEELAVAEVATDEEAGEEVAATPEAEADRSRSDEVTSSSAAALGRAASAAEKGESSDDADTQAAPVAESDASSDPAPSWASADAEKAAPAAAAPACDEVLCLLEGRACCGATAAKAPSADDAADERSDLPTSLERADIEKGLESVSGRLSSCGTKHGVTGSATIKFRILGSGKVQSANTTTGDAEFQQCVAAVAKKARFAKTQEGVTINYPVIMR